MAERKIEERFNPSLFDGAFFCSEATPHYFQQEIGCEYLNGKWGGALKVSHL